MWLLINAGIKGVLLGVSFIDGQSLIGGIVSLNCFPVLFVNVMYEIMVKKSKETNVAIIFMIQI